ncbi:MAG: hybrid sensor histidine kinase/response regulator [Candidatus Magnetominusculus sp. LBB02]|nr:hybrid sensor histidine kinase/response regulator [Candidatus Magnetominusculus sp. LBB02]
MYGSERINVEAEKTKILIVEDSITQAVFLRRILQRYNYEVIMAEDGLRGDEKARETSPSLIISDVNMPQMNGYEMCKKVKGSLGDIPIILLTVLSDPADIIHGLECGADNFLMKPYSEESLISRIDNLLTTARPHVNTGFEVELALGGSTYKINSGRHQILNLLVSTYETTLQQQRQLSEETKQRMEKERLLVQQSKMAEMGSMITAIAHQWRQPLNAISLVAQDLDDAYKFGEISEEFITEAKDTILGQVDFMTKTVDDFCGFLRPSKEKKLFDIKKAAADIVSMFQPYFSRGGISLNLHFAETDASATGYPNEFKQVILNLINNAKDAILSANGKAAPKIKGRIDIEVAVIEGKINVIVRDNGGGIDDNLIGQIFEPYFTTKESSKGTGIGLSLSKTIIETNMGWSLTARNIEGGAEFRIEI